jgi:hypothetical protein
MRRRGTVIKIRAPNLVGRLAVSNTVILRNAPVDLDSDAGQAFIVDCVRAGEGLISDRELAEKYEIDPADWQSITKDQTLGRLIRAERERRVLSGAAVREMSAKHLIKGPSILDQIMTAEASHPKHKIEAFKELRATAAAGSTESRPNSELFVIKIDLSAGGGPVEIYEKEIKIVDASAEDSSNLIPSKGKYDDDDRW